jgi:8-oxo-dGTP diphosphatase
MEPFVGRWAISEDLVYSGEDIDDAARRILIGLTKINSLEMYQSQTFGNPNRYLQERRVITTAYFALIRIEAFKVEVSSWAEELKWFPIYEIPLLAFDHNLILNAAFDLFKLKLSNQPLCFDLLPEKFTLNEMQQLYECAFDLEMDKANFRKKIKTIPLIEQQEKQVNVKHRPAKLFSFNQEKYLEIFDKYQYQFKM